MQYCCAAFTVQRPALSRWHARWVRSYFQQFFDAARPTRHGEAPERALLQLLLTALNRQRVLILIPVVLAEMQARLLELLPNPRLTRHQVRLLKTDKVVSGVEPTLGDLGVHPRTLEEFLAAFRDKYSCWRSAPNQMSWAVTNTDPSDSSNPAFSFWAARSSIISRWASNIRLRAVSETSLH